MPPRKSTATATASAASTSTPAPEPTSTTATSTRTVAPPEQQEATKTKKPRSCIPQVIVDKMIHDEKVTKLSLKAAQLKDLCELFIHTVVDEVMAGKKVTLTNMMTFKRGLRKARVHKAPRKEDNGISVVVNKPEHYVLSVEIKPNLRKQFGALSVQDNGAEEITDESSPN